MVCGVSGLIRSFMKTALQSMFYHMCMWMAGTKNSKQVFHNYCTTNRLCEEITQFSHQMYLFWICFGCTVIMSTILIGLCIINGNFNLRTADSISSNNCLCMLQVLLTFAYYMYSVRAIV